MLTWHGHGMGEYSRGKYEKDINSVKTDLKNYT